MENDIGIYAITHKETGAVYVGASSSLAKRKYNHYRDLHLNKHHCQKLQNDFNESACGNTAIDFRILEFCPVEALKELEKLHIDALSPAYNSNAAGGGVRTEITDEFRETMRKVMTGRQIRYVGEFNTPWGVFSSSHKAAKAINGMICQSAIWKACKSSETEITRRAYLKTRFLHENFDESIIGKSWSDIGFSFTAKI